MEKKKLGLSGKAKLELSKTVGGGTVKQSFSHGRVKSVAVEVKRVRTFSKNNKNNTALEEAPRKEKLNEKPTEESKNINNERILNTNEGNYFNRWPRNSFASCFENY